jgi:acyl-CoA thioester hydrolase
VAEYRFYYPIQVRWMDLDTQWHVNNSRFLSFLETARLAYIRQLGLWDGKSFFDINLIVADVHLTFVAPIELDQHIRVGVRVERIGNKSLIFDSQIEDAETGVVAATSSIVMVAYDYASRNAMPVPDAWRQAIREFEGI